MPLECLSHLGMKVLVEQRGRSCAQRSCEPDTCCHLFGGTAFLHATNLVVDPQFASPVVLSGPLAIQVFKRPMKCFGGGFAELEGEKLL